MPLDLENDIKNKQTKQFVRPYHGKDGLKINPESGDTKEDLINDWD